MSNASKPVTEDLVIQFLRDHLTSVHRHRANDVKSIKPETSLFDAGLLDSLSFLDVVQLLENRFTIVVPPEYFSPRELGSLAQLGAYVAAVAAGKPPPRPSSRD